MAKSTTLSKAAPRESLGLNLTQEELELLENPSSVDFTYRDSMFSEKRIGVDELRYIASKLQGKAKIESVSFVHVDFGKGDSFNILVQALSNVRSIGSIDLHGSILPLETPVLVGALVTKLQPRALDLSRTDLSNTEALALADALKCDKSLQILNVGLNRIGNEGILALADALKYNKSLKELHIRGNYYGDPVIKDILEAVQQNSTLEIIKLDGTSDAEDSALIVQIYAKVKQNQIMPVIEYIKQFKDYSTDLGDKDGNPTKKPKPFRAEDKAKLASFLKLDKNLLKKYLQEGEMAVSEADAGTILDRASTYLGETIGAFAAKAGTASLPFNAVDNIMSFLSIDDQVSWLKSVKLSSESSSSSASSSSSSSVTSLLGKDLRVGEINPDWAQDTEEDQDAPTAGTKNFWQSTAWFTPSTSASSTAIAGDSADPE